MKLLCGGAFFKKILFHENNYEKRTTRCPMF
jgi:hypothetical protein